MKVRIPRMIQDPRTARLEGIKLTEGFDPAREDFFLDGPITKRVAVVDFSPTTGGLVPGARFRPPPRGRKRGWYVNAEGDDVYKAKGADLYTPAFMQVSVFATVLGTLYMVEEGEEEGDTLGRVPTWGFDGAQLLVVPRAGQQRNAYYHRDSHSLQFFSFPSLRDPGKEIFTCLSRDIVAHETGHAIIDGIVPDLYNAITPQSLAIHEAIADLTALLMSLGSRSLRLAVLKKTRGEIIDTTAFSSIAEEFGHELERGGHGLRNLRNEKGLDTGDPENLVSRYSPHDLSLVLSGALYGVLTRIHEDLKDEYSKTTDYAQSPDKAYSASGRALWVAAQRLKRVVYRALDYLPPGDISYADYGRAIMAVDEVAYPDDPKIREWVREQFVRRHIVPEEAALDVQMEFRHKEPERLDVGELHGSDWAAYQFANAQRDLLQIPEDISFQVRPRLRVRKRYQYGRGEECIFKVAWDHVEENPVGLGYPEMRRFTVGTTLVLDWETGRILARLTNAPPERRLITFDRDYHLRKDEYEEQRDDRDVFVGGLAASGILRLGEYASGPGGRPLESVIRADVVEGAMKARATAKTLHIVVEEESDG